MRNELAPRRHAEKYTPLLSAHQYTIIISGDSGRAGPGISGGAKIGGGGPPPRSGGARGRSARTRASPLITTHAHRPATFEIKSYSHNFKQHHRERHFLIDRHFLTLAQFASPRVTPRRAPPPLRASRSAPLSPRAVLFISLCFGRFFREPVQGARMAGMTGRPYMQSRVRFLRIGGGLMFNW